MVARVQRLHDAGQAVADRSGFPGGRADADCDPRVGARAAAPPPGWVKTRAVPAGTLGEGRRLEAVRRTGWSSRPPAAMRMPAWPWPTVRRAVCSRARAGELAEAIRRVASGGAACRRRWRPTGRTRPAGGEVLNRADRASAAASGRGAAVAARRGAGPGRAGAGGSPARETGRGFRGSAQLARRRDAVRG